MGHERYSRQRPQQTSLLFRRPSRITYKGVDYGVDNPRLEGNGVMVNAASNETLEVPAEVQVNPREGLILLECTPLTNDSTILTADVTGGKFELKTVAGQLRFSIGDGNYYVSSSKTYTRQNVKLALRWSRNTAVYELIFLYGDSIHHAGSQYFEGDMTNGKAPAAFLSRFKFCTSGSAIISSFEISTAARRISVYGG